MQTNNHQIVDYSSILEKKYGKEGTAERAKFDEEAYAFYTSQILLDARKEAKMTQSELAKRINVTKSYISRIERDLRLMQNNIHYPSPFFQIYISESLPKEASCSHENAALLFIHTKYNNSKANPGKAREYIKSAFSSYKAPKFL